MVPDAGDRVLVSFKGTVKKVIPELNRTTHTVWIERDDGKTSIIRIGAGSTNIVEIIEPEYVDGGVYRDETGEFFLYTACGKTWAGFGSYGAHSFFYPARPLKRIDI